MIEVYLPLIGYNRGIFTLLVPGVNEGALPVACLNTDLLNIHCIFTQTLYHVTNIYIYINNSVFTTISYHLCHVCHGQLL